jgi:hypothetical protein
MRHITSVCVYCGSSSRGRKTHHEAAQRLGNLLVDRGIRLIYGGGRVGLMGVIADAVLAAGGEVTGVIPDFLEEREVGHTNCTELVVTNSMHSRKQKMAELSDGFVILPGGLGTLDETFEIVTWKQLGIHDKPIVIADIDGYWRPLDALIQYMIEERYVRPEYRELFEVVASVDDVLPTLDAMPPAIMRVDAEHI